MKEFDHSEREEIFSKAIKAGKRTYFLDVKEMKSGEQYIIITESKKRFNNDNGKFFYEKHKIFLYKEDFQKFSKGLSGVMHFVETGEKPEPDIEEDLKQDYSDIDFENLGPIKE